jgi:hypothetical protein
MRARDALWSKHRWALLCCSAWLLVVPCAAHARKLHVGQHCTKRLAQLYLRSHLDCVHNRLRQASLAALRQGEPLLVDTHGRIEPRNALEAFSKLVVHIPGVKVRQGAVGRPDDATGIVEAVIAQRRRLSSKQRSVLNHFLKGSAGRARIAANPTASDLSQLQTIALQASVRIANAGFPINHRLVVTFAPVDDPDVRAFAVPGWLAAVPGAADACVIGVNPSVVGDNIPHQRRLMLHELFHCAQFEFYGSEAEWHRPPQWLKEGSAEWVSAVLAQEWNGIDLSNAHWALWLHLPMLDLGKREYDALGFFALLAQSGVDVFARLPSAIEAGAKGGDFPAYAAAVGSPPSAFFDTWGPGFLRLGAVGPNWELTGPGLPSPVDTAHIPVDNGTDVGYYVDPRGAAGFSLGLEADVVVVQSGASHGRLHTIDGAEVPLHSETLCTAPDGCNCPDGARLSTRPVGRGFAVVGWQGGGVSFTGETLDEACARATPPQPVPKAGSCHLLKAIGAEQLIPHGFWNTLPGSACEYGRCLETFKEAGQTKCANAHGATLVVHRLGSRAAAQKPVKQLLSSAAFKRVSVGADLAALGVKPNGCVLAMARGSSFAVLSVGASADKPKPTPHWDVKSPTLRMGRRLAAKI